MFRNNFNDELRCNFSRLVRINDILKFTHGNIHGDLALFQIGVGNEFVECPFQFTDVGLDILSNVIQDIITQIDLFRFDFFAQDRHSGLIIRIADISHESAFKTGADSFFQSLHLFWRLIGSDNDLLSSQIKGIESIEKFLLRAFLTY